MKNVRFLGRNGFIGSTVFDILSKKYSMKETGHCDVLVNCAGFAITYIAQKNPELMRHVEDVTFERISKHSFDRLIHISSIYVEANPDENYAVIKKEVEDRLFDTFDDVLVLRLGSVLGKGLKKNAVYDLVNERPLWVSADSVYNYISTEDVANIIIKLIEHPRQGILRVGSSESISISDIAKLLHKDPTYGNINYNDIVMDVSELQKFYKVKTSREYVKEFYKGQTYV